MAVNIRPSNNKPHAIAHAFDRSTCAILESAHADIEKALPANEKPNPTNEMRSLHDWPRTKRASSLNQKIE